MAGKHNGGLTLPSPAFDGMWVFRVLAGLRGYGKVLPWKKETKVPWVWDFHIVALMRTPGMK